MSQQGTKPSGIPVVRSLHGTFGPTGYQIFTDTGAQIYSAGNSPQDSQAYVDPSVGVSVSLLEVYCNATGIEMAAEWGVPWLGCDPEE